MHSMKVLVTGGAGFVAGHLTAELLAHRHEVVLSDVKMRDVRGHDIPRSSTECGEDCIPADLTKLDAMRTLVERVHPDAVVHLGAISFVPEAAKNLDLLAKVNVEGTENLLKAVREFAPLARFLFVSTAQVLNHPPLSAYAASKLAAEACVQAFGKLGLDVMVVRPANHTGPRQSPRFVVPSFLQQAVEIKAGRKDHFTTGNLDSIRDFTDVRDVAAAYRLLLEKGKPGETYAVGASERLKMKDVLDLVQRTVGVEAPAITSSSLYRPTDASCILDTSAIRSLGWSPRYTLPQTLHDMLPAF